jgi:hypothetical protein
MDVKGYNLISKLIFFYIFPHVFPPYKNGRGWTQTLRLWDEGASAIPICHHGWPASILI